MSATILDHDSAIEHGFRISFETRTGGEKKEPLAILWNLIESYEVDIFAVSLFRITQDFLAYMHREKINLEEQSDFAYLLARLIFYKSRQLLPNPGIEADFETDTLPFELVEQLLEYKKLQQAAEVMREIETRAHLRFGRSPGWNQYESDLDFLQVDLLSFLKAFRDFLDREEKSRPMQIVDENVTIEEMIDYLESRLTIESESSFFKAVTSFSVLRIIVCFMALLELAKMKRIVVKQSAQYDDILFAKYELADQIAIDFERDPVT